MKFVLMTFLALFFSVQTHAQFDGGMIKLSNVEQNTVRTLKYIYRNKSTTPHIIHLSNYVDSTSPCRISKPDGKPVLPGKTLAIYASCRFVKAGMNSRTLATANVKTKDSSYTLNLQFQAMVNENLSNRIVDGKNHTTCIEKDLNRGKILPKIPAFDQDGVGSCYAHASAVMYEYELKKKNNHTAISPIDIGLLYKTDSGEESDNNINGGFVFDTLNEINKTGIASRECINKVLKAELKKTNLTSENYLFLIQSIYKELDSLRAKNAPSKKLQALCDDYKITSEELNYLTKILDKTLLEYLNSEFAQCAKTRNKTAHALSGKISDIYAGSKSKRKELLDLILNENNPASISMCAEIIQGKPDHVGVSSNGKEKKASECGYHAVVITGRKRVGDKCQYLIRNSWGADWKRKDLTCACQTSKGYFQDCSKAPKDATNKTYVGCWMDEGRLLNNTYRVMGIK